MLAAKNNIWRVGAEFFGYRRYRKFLQPGDVASVAGLKPLQIPRKIHQTGGFRHLSSEVVASIRRLRKQNPGWAYHFYTDREVTDYIATHFPQYLATFERINPTYGAARADLFRYLLMYREGGVYLDIKSTFSKPFKQTLKEEDEFLLSHWPNREGEEYPGWGFTDDLADARGEFQQCFIIARPGHPYLKAVIEFVISNIANYQPHLHGVGNQGIGEAVLRLTGPIAFSQAIAPIRDAHPHRCLEANVDLGYVYTVFDTFKSHHNSGLGHYSASDADIVLHSEPSGGFVDRHVNRPVFLVGKHETRQAMTVDSDVRSADAGERVSCLVIPPADENEFSAMLKCCKSQTHPSVELAVLDEGMLTDLPAMLVQEGCGDARVVTVRKPCHNLSDKIAALLTEASGDAFCVVAHGCHYHREYIELMQRVRLSLGMKAMVLGKTVAWWPQEPAFAVTPLDPPEASLCGDVKFCAHLLADAAPGKKNLLEQAIGAGELAQFDQPGLILRYSGANHPLPEYSSQPNFDRLTRSEGNRYHDMLKQARRVFPIERGT